MNNRSSKLRLLAAAGAVGSLILAACGDDDDTADERQQRRPPVLPRRPTTGCLPHDGGLGWHRWRLALARSRSARPTSPRASCSPRSTARRLPPRASRCRTSTAIGAREIYYDAIAEGEIDLVPEYTNSLLAELVQASTIWATLEATTVEDQVALLKEHLDEGLDSPRSVDRRGQGRHQLHQRCRRGVRSGQALRSGEGVRRDQASELSQSSRSAIRSVSSASRSSTTSSPASSSRSPSARRPTASSPVRSTAATCSPRCR